MYPVIHLSLAILWMTMTGEFSVMNLLVGFILGGFALFVAQPVLGPTGYFRRGRAAISLILFVLYELVIANIRVAGAVLLPGRFLRPGVVRVPLDAETDIEVAFLSNTITLTPGTFAMDVVEDGKVLLVHALFIESEDNLVAEIKNDYERRILEVLRD